MSLDRLVGVFGLLFFVAIGLRVAIVYRKTGALPVALHHSNEVHDYVHRLIFFIILVEGMNIVAFRLYALHALFPNNQLLALYRYFGPFESLDTTPVQIFGLALSYGGLVWSVVAQTQMGTDWRVGMDKSNQNSLVLEGVFRVSRHPIYLGFMLISVGLFFAVPNVVTLICAVLTIVTLSIEARLEEQYLLERNGDVYRHYLRQTRRWI